MNYDGPWSPNPSEYDLQEQADDLWDTIFAIEAILNVEQYLTKDELVGALKRHIKTIKRED